MTLAILLGLLGASPAQAQKAATFEVPESSDAFTLRVLDAELAKSKPGQKGLLVGCQMFSVEQLKQYRDHLKAQASGRAPRAAFDWNYVNGVPRKWTNGVVPYAFRPSSLPGQIAPVGGPLFVQFARVLRGWQKAADLSFEYENGSTDYINVSATLLDGVNFSWIGRSGGEQPLFLNNWEDNLIMHEVGHALGLTHEHQRSDRDNFVNVWWWNALPLTQINFIKVGDSDNRTTYDYYSIMHYDLKAYALGWPKGLETLNPKNAMFKPIIGNQRNWFGQAGTIPSSGIPPFINESSDEYKQVGPYGYLSPKDREAIRKEYGWPGKATGIVALKSSGAGLPGVAVHITGNGNVAHTSTRMRFTEENPAISAGTGIAGYFKFDGLPRGTYTIKPELATYRFEPPSATITIAAVGGSAAAGSQVSVDFKAVLDEVSPPKIEFERPAATTTNPHAAYTLVDYVKGKTIDDQSGTRATYLALTNWEGKFLKWSTGVFDSTVYVEDSHRLPVTNPNSGNSPHIWHITAPQWPTATLVNGRYDLHVMGVDRSDNASCGTDSHSMSITLNLPWSIHRSTTTTPWPTSRSLAASLSTPRRPSRKSSTPSPKTSAASEVGTVPPG